MHRLTDTPLAAASGFLDRPAVLTQDRTWTWGEVHGAAIALAGRLPPGTTVCNLCDTRLGFLVTWLAALRRGCMQILPPSAGRSEMVEILKASTRPVVVVDDAASESSWADHALCFLHTPTPPPACQPDSGLTWLRDGDAEALLVRLYTSGSTGAPEPQTKTLGQLSRGAHVLAARLDEHVKGGVQAVAQIICSVPPQHMFGLETSVMLPLVTGIPLRDCSPLLPADVQAAFAGAAAGAAWVATPLHLRALALSGVTLPGCRLVLTSTMPLSAALAAQAETLSGAPVMEIYGSTETGVVAMRRTAVEAVLRPVEGVHIEPLETGTRVRGAHFSSPQTLADQVEPDGGGGFVLLGRRGDLIKIGGRRASLMSLNRLLEDLPGLTDGVFYLPASTSGTQRLVLIHVGPALDHAATRRWLRSRMDPLFLPRAIIRVDRLPRTAAGKLPRAALDELYAAHQSAREPR
ncbi:MAG: long-chain fatty acid--CoA ligase [Ramlibacter sp.]|nr:long-chain fatty acid--CoA ligase [Ramlibacter sp.]